MGLVRVFAADAFARRWYSQIAVAADNDALRAAVCDYITGYVTMSR